MTVGVDVGGRKVAIVCIEREFYWTYETKARSGQKVTQELYWQFYQGVNPRLEGINITLGDLDWYMESPVVAGARNLQSTIRVAQTSGLVHAAVKNVREVPVSSWKKSTVGNGNASKSQVREWLDDNHPEVAKMCRGNQDLYDAACIALHGRGQME